MVSMMTAMASVAAASDPVNLAVGDPARKDKTLSVPLDTIMDTASGASITPEELVDRLRDTKILLLGESHTSAEFHRVQAQVLAALQRAGRPVIVGLEMFPYTQQPALDEWRTGTLSEQAFVDRAAWYQHWGYNWGYYRDIFVFARDHRLRMAALNAPRAVVSAVRKKGFKNLTPEEAAHIPADIDLDSADHLTLFKSYFASESGDGATHTSGMSDDAWKAMLGAQATWDATMGHHALQAFREANDPAAIVIVLVGSGHVAYDLGIKRQLARWFDGRVTSIVPVEVAAQTHATTVRASYANFVWGVPAEAFTRYPSLGISAQSLPAAPGTLSVLAVDDDAPAGRAGVTAGDELVAFDGQPITARADLDRRTAAKDWGDVILLTVRRAGKEIVLRIPLQRVERATAAAGAGAAGAYAVAGARVGVAVEAAIGDAVAVSADVAVGAAATALAARPVLPLR